MGFFSELKDDLSQAVNELMPEEGGQEAANEMAQDDSEMISKASESVDSFDTDLSQMLDQVEEKIGMEAPAQEHSYAAPVVEEKRVEMSISSSSKHSIDEESVFTESMIINGNIATEGSLDIRGSIVGNIEALGKLNITGTIQGNSQAAEIFADGAKITGELRSLGSIKVGQSSVIIGNIFANSAVIAGAVKGDIDVRGPVILDASAIIMGDIKSKSVQINNGAVIEGMCSQCYAEVNPSSFFEELKKMK